MNFDFLYNPYKSKRMNVFGENGMVATSQPLAAQAGLHILRKGGNAIDAAVATAAALTVVEPTSNGIGSDSFAIFSTADGEIHGMNSSGRSPMSISSPKLKELGHEQMPKVGTIPITTPGAVKSWAEMTEKFGNLSLKENLEPAIDYAEKGYPVSPTLGNNWQRAFNAYKKMLNGKEFEEYFKTFSIEGRAPKIGEKIILKNHAKTLKMIAESNAKEFYEGEIADKIDKFMKENGGFLRKDDLSNHKVEWVRPLNVDYRGHEIWELPPNGQGIITLMALNILNEINMKDENEVYFYHNAIEALKLAFSDGKEYITDIDQMNVSLDELLSYEYAKKRRGLINHYANLPKPGRLPKGGTVYLATADKWGNMVSFIQSNYMGFGSGIVIPETGISMQNRGHTFSLNPDHSNYLKPHKKTYHTIIPGFITKMGKPIGPFGVMGGYMQPQGHLQVILNMLDLGLNPQAALDAPRWQWIEGNTIYIEKNFPEHLAQMLSNKGHDIKVMLNSGSFGRGQIIWRMDNDIYCGGTEPRTDSQIAVY